MGWTTNCSERSFGRTSFYGKPHSTRYPFGTASRTAGMDSARYNNIMSIQIFAVLFHRLQNDFERNYYVFRPITVRLVDVPFKLIVLHTNPLVFRTNQSDSNRRRTEFTA